ncbi:MAG: serine/threonine-protein kinase [Candidatus Eiseniibacteriota bacterium]
MKDHVTVYTQQDAPPDGANGSRFAKLDTATREAAHKSLSQLAFVYATAYFVAFLYYWFLAMQKQGGLCAPPRQDLILAAVSVTYALLTGFRCRATSCTPVSFARAAEGFLVMGTIGIAGNYWAWDRHFAATVEDLIGVSWVGVWLITYPAIVVLTPRRFATGALLGVLALAAIIYSSALVRDVPMDDTHSFARIVLVPTLICVGIAVYCAHRAFRMAEDVSEARRMGSYRLTEKIGSGGMGEVWKAEHHMLARPAAIKLIRREALGDRSDSASRTLVARFAREAQATAALTSPHTVQIYDFGITGGSFYCVMELLEGLDLKSLVDRFGSVPPARAVHLLRQACDSLGDAHESGLIHRDVKPANLFTCRRGRAYDFVKVLDFGLVKDTGAREEDRTQLTMQGVVSGTPAFMAPELAAGSAAVDGRADLYALGCVGYWLLTGTLVFPAATPVAMLLQHAHDEPVPPSTRSELEVPAALDRLILDCLRKRPDDRPKSARELAARLADLERECGAWTAEHAERWWRIHLPSLAAPAPAFSRP